MPIKVSINFNEKDIKSWILVKVENLASFALIINLAQLVSLSVALPAKLVF